MGSLHKRASTICFVGKSPLQKKWWYLIWFVRGVHGYFWLLREFVLTNWAVKMAGNIVSFWQVLYIFLWWPNLNHNRVNPDEHATLPWNVLKYHTSIVHIQLSQFCHSFSPFPCLNMWGNVTLKGLLLLPLKSRAKFLLISVEGRLCPESECWSSGVMLRGSGINNHNKGPQEISCEVPKKFCPSQNDKN